ITEALKQGSRSGNPRLKRYSARPGAWQAREHRLTAALPNDRAPAGAVAPSSGEVAERSNAPHSKCGLRATVTWVRIPPSPPHIYLIYLHFKQDSLLRAIALV